MQGTETRVWNEEPSTPVGMTSPWPVVRITRYALEGLRTHGLTFLRDALVIIIAFFAADLVRFDGHIRNGYEIGLLLSLLFIIPVYALSIYGWGVHRRMWQYAGIPDLRTLLQAWLTATAVITLADLAVGRKFLLPMSVVIIGSVFTIAGLLFIRLWRRLEWYPRMAEEAGTLAATRVLIVGAGRAGQIVAKDLAMGPGQAVGFLDDDPAKWNRVILGIPVLGSVDSLREIAAAHKVDTIAVAIPSATSSELDRVMGMAQETDARVQILPSQAEVLAGRSPSFGLHDVKLDTVLNRIPSSELHESSLVQETVEGRVVLVTGAAGSIGSELCRQLLLLKPAQVVALDNNETGLFHLVQELSEEPYRDVLVPVLASITADPKLSRVFEQYRPQVVFHAAAYKHVPMLQHNADEAVFVNVKGTLNLCSCAVEYGCERFVFISTDKAVEPANILGYSKRIGELLVRAHQTHANTIFCSVRFGNVIGSRGSAVPEFIKQIRSGGPVTVTHPNVERYFMTIPEAVSLVIQASALADGGELFMLDMGRPIKIGDLVKRLIRLHGLRIGKDIEIEYTGLRPGEKMTEELVFDGEETHPTEVPGIRLVLDALAPDLQQLEFAVKHLIHIATYEEPPVVFAMLSTLANGAPAAEDAQVSLLGAG